MWYYLKQKVHLVTGLAILLVMGIIFGSIAVQTLSATQATDLSTYLENFYNSLPQQLSSTNRKNLFFRSVLDNLLKIGGLIWLLGLTMIGSPLILGIVFIRGFVIGFTIGFIIDQMLINGVLVAMASILPHNLLLIPAIIIISTASLSFSLAAGKTLFGSSNESILNKFLATTVIVIMCSSLLIFAALVEIYVTPAFIQLATRLI